MAKLRGIKGTRRFCPIARKRFKAKAKPISIPIGPDEVIKAAPLEYPSGSFGWRNTSKITVEVDGVPLRVQVGLRLVVIGSKDVIDPA